MCECVRMCVLVCDRAHLYVHTCTDMCFEASMCVFMRVPEFKCITMLSYKGICIIMHFVCVCVCVCVCVTLTHLTFTAYCSEVIGPSQIT